MKALEITYWDRCDVYELDTIKVKSITKKDWVQKYSNIKCALSKIKMPRSAQTESENQIIGDFILFMDDGIKIRAGSKIICRKYDLRAGEPVVYEGSHQEIACFFEKRA